MQLATTEEQLHVQGLRAALARGVRPAIGFTHPDDVVKDPDLPPDEKRAILTSWASDASSVRDQPTMRWLLGTPDPVPYAAVRHALLRLEQLCPPEPPDGEVVVSAFGDGWLVKAPAGLEPLLFRSGARAEREAEGLARALTAAGRDIKVVVLDRSGQLAGSKRFWAQDARASEA